jgi:hypothetical protein
VLRERWARGAPRPSERPRAHRAVAQDARRGRSARSPRRYWDAIVGNGGEESACGWCKDRWGFSWQITPRVLLEATTSADGAAAKRAFEAMMPMGKIDVATIEAALRGDAAEG